VLLIALLLIIVVVAAVLGAVFGTVPGPTTMMMTTTTKTPVKTSTTHWHQPDDFSHTCFHFDGDGTVDEMDLILLITLFYDSYSAPSERVLFAVSEQPTTADACSQHPAPTWWLLLPERANARMSGPWRSFATRYLFSSVFQATQH
jgi:hypothetical protein